MMTVMTAPAAAAMSHHHHRHHHHRHPKAMSHQPHRLRVMVMRMLPVISHPSHSV
jgi:hypothetical protein